VKKLALGLAVGGLLVWQAGATIAYDAPSTTLGNQGFHGGNDGPWNLGEQFTVNSAVTVTELGAFDSGLNGWGTETITVAIYNSANAIVGSSVAFSGISGPSEGTLAPGSAYRFQAVAPISLAAGQTYTIVASGLGSLQNYDWNAYYNGGNTVITTDTGGGLLSFNNSYYSSYSGTPALPGNLDPNGPAAYGAGSFNFTPVPEAAGFALAGVAMLGLVYAGRAYSQKLKLA